MFNKGSSHALGNGGIGFYNSQNRGYPPLGSSSFFRQVAGTNSKSFANNRSKIEKRVGQSKLSFAEKAVTSASIASGVAAYGAALSGYSLASTLGASGALIGYASSNAGLSLIGGMAIGAMGGLGIVAAGVAIAGVGKVIKSSMDAYGDKIEKERHSVDYTADKSKTKSRVLTGKEKYLLEREQRFNEMLDKTMSIQNHNERDVSLSTLSKLEIPSGSKSLFFDSVAKHAIRSTTVNGEKIDKNSVKSKIDAFSKNAELSKLSTFDIKSRVGLVPGFDGSVIKEGKEDFVIGKRNELMHSGIEQSKKPEKEITSAEKAFTKMLDSAKAPEKIKSMFDLRLPNDEAESALINKYSESYVNSKKQFDAKEAKEYFEKFAVEKNLGDEVVGKLSSHADLYVEQMKTDLKMSEKGEIIGFKEKSVEDEKRNNAEGIKSEKTSRLQEIGKEAHDNSKIHGPRKSSMNFDDKQEVKSFFEPKIKAAQQNLNEINVKLSDLQKTNPNDSQSVEDLKSKRSEAQATYYNYQTARFGFVDKDTIQSAVDKRVQNGAYSQEIGDKYVKNMLDNAESLKEAGLMKEKNGTFTFVDQKAREVLSENTEKTHEDIAKENLNEYKEIESQHDTQQNMTADERVREMQPAQEIAEEEQTKREVVREDITQKEIKVDDEKEAEANKKEVEKKNNWAEEIVKRTEPAPNVERGR